MKKYILILLTLSPMAWGASYADPKIPTTTLEGLSREEVDLIFSSEAFSPTTAEKRRSVLTVTPKVLVGIGATPHGLERLRSVNDIVLKKDGTPKEFVFCVLERIKETLFGLYWENAGLCSGEIQRICKLNMLQDLNLKFNKLRHEGITDLCHLSHIVRLRLSNNDLGDEGAKIIAASAPSTLRALSLDKNKIGRAGIEAILDRLTDLHTLYVAGNNIGDEEVNLITSRLPELAYFAASHVSNASLDGLLRLNLNYLNLPNNTLTNPGKAALRAKFPRATLVLE